MNTGIRKDHLQQIYAAAIAAVHPSVLIPKVLSLKNERLQLGEVIAPLNSFRKIFIAGAGKAAAAMAIETENILTELIADGVIAVKNFPSAPLKYIRPIVAGHPLPDTNSVFAAQEIMNMMENASGDDLVIFLLSGGASSLVTDLPDFCELNDINKMFELLINSGASIDEINTVRKHLSTIKGGNLVKSTKATIVTFVISDVPENDLSVIGSGPTVPDQTTFSDAFNVLEKYGLIADMPPGILNHLLKGVNGDIPENPTADKNIFKRCKNYIIGDLSLALKAAAFAATQLGYETVVFPKLLKGDAESAANELLSHILESGKDVKQCFIAGGETTVHVKGSGKGGRNQHFALAAAIRLQDHPGITMLAAGTDGSDGPTDAAGAIVDDHIYAAAKMIGLVPEDFLRNNDAYHFFEKTGGLFKSGPTDTNVMDIVIVLTS